MATVTTPDLIAAPSDADAYDPTASMAALATSVQAALYNRENYEYLWADAAARTAETNMVTMSLGFQQDTKAVYIYNGSSWKLWQTAQSVAFTPTWTNLTIGNAVQAATYSVAGGTVFVRGFLTFGTTTVMGAICYMTAPLPLNNYITGAPNGGTDQGLGNVTLVDTGVQGYPGVANTFATGGVIYIRPQVFNAAGTYANSTTMSSIIPFTWATGDYLTYNYSYLAD